MFQTTNQIRFRTGSIGNFRKWRISKSPWLFPYWNGLILDGLGGPLFWETSKWLPARFGNTSPTGPSVFPTSSRPNNWRKTWTSSCGCSRHLHRGTGHKNDIAWLQSPEKSWVILYCTGGWPTPLKNDGVKVSWDDYIFPIWWESHNPFHGSKPPTSVFIHIYI